MSPALVASPLPTLLQAHYRVIIQRNTIKCIEISEIAPTSSCPFVIILFPLYATDPYFAMTTITHSPIIFTTRQEFLQGWRIISYKTNYTPSPLSCGICYGGRADRVCLETGAPPSAERRLRQDLLAGVYFRTPVFILAHCS